MREFIVEADGGSRGNPGPAGYGAVVSDAVTGETLAEAAEYLGVATNNVAEYRGLLAGLRTAHALDPAARVHVRMDSKLVVEQMSGRWKIKHPGMKPLAAEANRVFPPGQVTYEWIPRAQNTHADRLANEAMDAGARGEQWSATSDDIEAEAIREAAGTAETRAAAAVSAGEAGTGGTGVGVPGDDAAVAAGSRAAGAARVGDGGPEQQPPSSTTPQPSSPAKQSQTPGWSAAPDLGTPATLVLLRHGETPLTPQKRFSGSGGTDPSLSDAGREQAQRVAAALARRGTVQAVVASPLARTQETARVVAARLGLDVTTDEGLRETHFGAWEGLTFGEVRERHPEDLNAWLADPEAHPTGGGESFAETATRIAATRDRLVAAHAGRT
ncbi:bifunctional RNase H/acid phosphatase, partial [Streptomyces sp. SAS_269]|uniref:bifunctional RNase H/acid phosphatase n=1 Tax=Streptomyces sp. SAS_269 TaxID=3412749 RepID=UPI00403CC876